MVNTAWKALVFVCLTTLLCPRVQADVESASEVKTGSLGKQYEGIVRIENSSIVPDFATPWNAGRPSGGSGTGFYIGKNRFLTNAHVVSNSSRVIIKKVGDSKPYAARILHIAHDCDLAMLAVDESAPFEDVTPLEVSQEIPKLDTTLRVVGYPIGGERISVTRGVVSRIDFLAYSHSAVDYHLTVQIDAAINPGNSGGPVLQGDKVIGVAFQGYSGAVAQNTGYMIPTPVVNRFLKDVEDDSYDHYVDLAVSEFPLINPAQRKALGLPNNGQGIMVSNVDSQGSAGGKLQLGDVMLEINGSPIASNGFIDIEGERVNMNEIVERKFAGDKITLKIWRDREEKDVEIELKRFLPYLINARQYEKRPEYVMYSGLVFQPLDRNMMSAHNITDQNVRYYFNYYSSEELYKKRPEIVVLTKILPDSINTHVEGYIHNVVDKINGVEIKKLADVPKALQEGEGRYTVIELEGEGRPIVLEKSKVPAAQVRIMSKYGVRESHYVEE